MDRLDELLKIKELLDSGIIFETEFKELKNNLIQLDNNEKNTSGIIPNNITKCSNCDSIINDNETICKNCDNIDSKITSGDSQSENIIPISNSKIKYVFLGIITLCLVIGLNGYYNNSNKNIEEPPPSEVSAPTPSTSIPNETISNEVASDTMPAVQNTVSPQEVDEGGDYNENTSENIDSNGSTNTSKSDIEESVNNIDNGNGIINHIVIKGETMSSIAKKYNINRNELYKLYNAQPKTYEFYKANSNPEKSLKPNTLIIIPSNLIRSK
jgi:RNA polymerase subunit RPABC4/transcription elongation factor Spt4